MLANPKKRKNRIIKIPPPPKEIGRLHKLSSFSKSFCSIKQS